ncbi:NOL1/NOP2/sun family protein [Tritrichomonas foetus]|uniref:NOL1/NOP2/sun family protein n=1 Tax=Tritrichomonas foetus TaxID=1144522 RepID=A0A1J4IZY1_9EUKA|nr:NOL1/NOP2/sun family protein [Tritrichomonas foetus]|eukprot:OHS92738.1 NOL1/NOP2/sun family protein [Tritrichomonas foetus]
MGKKSRSHQRKPSNDGNKQSNQLGNIAQEFIDFYKPILVPAQMPEEEFNLMLNYYKKPLPHVFRLSHIAPDHDRLEAELTKLFSELASQNQDFSEYHEFPKQFGRVYKMAVDKTQIRKLPEFEKFNSWLRFNTDVGNCHRQEFVSMIPPLFLDVKEDSSVLDTCAAPGSKTAQIMEMLTTGYIVANDSNAKRCHDLVHQLQRVGTHNALITCQNGAKFELGFDQFDRVLCDVPCTGDGTIRKNPESGSKWSKDPALNLHYVQKNILLRGLELLKKDGICVYSTCSMNPIEDEAVISEVATELGLDKFEIVDCSKLYPDLKRHPGLTKWPEIAAELAQSETNPETTTNPESKPNSESAPEKGENAENAGKGEKQETEKKGRPFEKKSPKELLAEVHTESKIPGIEHCMRFYPQDHDSGGFFVAVLRKVSEFDRKTEPKPAKELKEAAFHPLEKVSQKCLDEIYRMYALENVKQSQFFVRDEKKVNKVYYMSEKIAELVNKYGSEALHTVSAGVTVFNYKSYAKKSPEVPYVSQEGIKVVFAKATRRKYALTPQEMYMLLKAGATGLQISKFDEERQKIFEDKPRNASIFYVDGTKFMYSGHLAKFSLTLYLKKDLLQNEIKQLTAQFPEIKVDNEE